MNVEIDGLTLNYHRSGSGRPLLLLHGWGGSIQTMAPLHRFLEAQCDVVSLDLPGFGASDAPPEVWGNEAYGRCVAAFVERLGLEHPAVIGHSFGGKVAIRLAALGIPSQLVLIDSAGIRRRRGADWYLKVYGFKLAKRLAALPGLRGMLGPHVEAYRRRAGSADYRAAAGVMRDILVRSVNEDLRDLLPTIAVPTLLLWGENDTDTPPADARLMASLVPDAGLVVLEGAGHYAYVDQLARAQRILAAFLLTPT